MNSGASGSNSGALALLCTCSFMDIPSLLPSLLARLRISSRARAADKRLAFTNETRICGHVTPYRPSAQPLPSAATTRAYPCQRLRMSLECGDTQSHLLAALQRPSFVGFDGPP